MATTVEIMAAFLARAGVRRIYGVPGAGVTLDLIEAFRRQQMEFLLTHHETSGAIMAATEGDLADRPGVCLVAGGTGAAGAAAGVAHAFLDRAPLLILTGRPSRAALRRAPGYSLDHLDLLGGAVKASKAATAPRAGRLLAWAWREALAPPRGPVHIDLPADEAIRRARWHEPRLEAERALDPSPSRIRAAAELLGRWGRVLVIAGLECRRRGVGRALQLLVEHLGAPLLATLRAKGVLAEDHPLAAGVYAGSRLEGELLSKAEGILAVGLDPAEIAPRPWRTELPTVVLAECAQGHRPYDPACELLADLPTSLEALREALPPGGSWGLAAWAAAGSVFKARTRALLAEASTARGRIGVPPHRVVELAREIFPRQTTVCVDPGIDASVVGAFWDAYEPKACLCSNGLAGRGYAMPAAIAARLAQPDRPVLAFLGDDGFLQSMPELAMAAWQRIPFVGIVFVDGSLGVSRIQQQRKRYAPVGVSLGKMDIPKLAESFGALGMEVEEEAGLRSALADAATTTQPAIIAVRVRPASYRRMVEILQGKPEERR
jgi:acetolactate synthase-1/2/3 large subunit